ncbi:hypothetical protein SAMN05444157_0828 [Frankineae bacterium MT45]|nr:hypothetical protein SAMN05444157_0828 [Frankineae bacterium MT45]
MGPTQVNGLPAHILLVHFVIVMVPLAALLTVLSAVWPAARRRLGVLTPLVALAALITVPVATHAGEWLKQRVHLTPLILRHTSLGHELLPWAIGIFLVAAAQWAYFHWYVKDPAESRTDGVAGEAAPRTNASAGTAVTIVFAALAVIASVGAVAEVYRIGESGSKAVWSGSFSQTPRTN